MKYLKKLALLDYKIVIAKDLIRWNQSRQKAVPLSRPSKKKEYFSCNSDHGHHLPEFQPTQPKRCILCLKEGKKIDLSLYA